MSRLITGDMSLWTVDSVDFLPIARGVTLTLSDEVAQFSPLTRLGEANTPVRQSGALEFAIGSLSGTAPFRLSNLDVNVFAIGGTSHLSFLRGGSFRATNKTKDVPGVADRYNLPIVTKQSFSMDFELVLPLTASALIAEIPFGPQAGKQVIFDIEINSVPVTMPGLLTNFEHIFSDGEEQMYRATVLGQSPDSGTYPTDPSVAGATLLSKQIVDPRTALAFALTSHPTQGMAYAGSVIFPSYGFTFDDRAIVEETYSGITVGTVTGVKNYA